MAKPAYNQSLNYFVPDAYNNWTQEQIDKLEQLLNGLDNKKIKLVVRQILEIAQDYKETQIQEKKIPRTAQVNAACEDVIKKIEAVVTLFKMPSSHLNPGQNTPEILDQKTRQLLEGQYQYFQNKRFKPTIDELKAMSKIAKSLIKKDKGGKSTASAQQRMAEEIAILLESNSFSLSYYQGDESRRTKKSSPYVPILELILEWNKEPKSKARKLAKDALQQAKVANKIKYPSKKRGGS